MNDKLMSALVDGGTGLAVALLVVAFHNRTGLDAGDVMGFLGALCGTGLAVAGAVWIEDRKRKADAAEKAEPVLHALLTLETASRPFFGDPERRRETAEHIDLALHRLDLLLEHYPPQRVNLIALFGELRLGADILTGEHFLEENEKAPMVACPERSNVERKLEYFDRPLKKLIIAYSRIVDPKSDRAVPHLKLPDL